MPRPARYGNSNAKVHLLAADGRTVCGRDPSDMRPAGWDMDAALRCQSCAEGQRPTPVDVTPPCPRRTAPELRLPPGFELGGRRPSTDDRRRVVALNLEVSGRALARALGVAHTTIQTDLLRERVRLLSERAQERGDVARSSKWGKANAP